MLWWTAARSFAVLSRSVVVPAAALTETTSRLSPLLWRPPPPLSIPQPSLGPSACFYSSSAPAPPPADAEATTTAAAAPLAAAAATGEDTVYSLRQVRAHGWVACKRSAVDHPMQQSPCNTPHAHPKGLQALGRRLLLGRRRRPGVRRDLLPGRPPGRCGEHPAQRGRRLHRRVQPDPQPGGEGAAAEVQDRGAQRREAQARRRSVNNIVGAHSGGSSGRRSAGRGPGAAPAPAVPAAAPAALGPGRRHNSSGSGALRGGPRARGGAGDADRPAHALRPAPKRQPAAEPRHVPDAVRAAEPGAPRGAAVREARVPVCRWGVEGCRRGAAGVRRTVWVL